MSAVVEIPLTQGKVTRIDAADLELVSSRNWWAVESHSGFYAATKVARPDGSRRVLHMQRFLMGEPEDLQVDHRNGDTLDNRRSNLRVATRSQNKANSSKYRRNASGFKGVYWKTSHKTWQAQVRHEKHLYCLGHFHNPADAARAYDAKARELHGAFARCNFPI